MGRLGPGPASASPVNSSHEPEHCICNLRTCTGASSALGLWRASTSAQEQLVMSSGLKVWEARSYTHQTASDVRDGIPQAAERPQQLRSVHEVFFTLVAH